MKTIPAWGAALALAAGAATAHAHQFIFTGRLPQPAATLQFAFHLDHASDDVRVWTDSYRDGRNFDPVISVFDAAGQLVDMNDDNPFVGRRQTLHDAGLSFDSLAAGHYVVALGAYLDPFSSGTPGSFYRLRIAGADGASVVAVPEPSAPALLALGALVLGFVGRRRART